MIARNVTGIFQIVFLRVLIGAHFSHQFQDLVFNCLKEKRKSIRIFCQFNRIHQASLVALRGHIRIPNWKWILKSLRWSCLIFLFISLANSFFFFFAFNLIDYLTRCRTLPFSHSVGSRDYPRTKKKICHWKQKKRKKTNFWTNAVVAINCNRT